MKTDYKKIIQHMRNGIVTRKEITLAFVYGTDDLEEQIYLKPNRALLEIFELEFNEGHQMSWYNWKDDVI